MADRETLIRSLAVLAAELETLDRGIRWAGLKAASARSEADQHGGHDDPDSRELAAHHRSAAAAQDARRKALASIRTRLDVVGAALAQDEAAWSSERASHERFVDLALTIGRRIDPQPANAAVAPVASPLPPVVPEVPGLPLLSSCVGAYTQSVRDAGRSEAYAIGIAGKLGEFIAIVGDKPLSAYVKKDLRTFGKIIADMPNHWTKLKEFQGSTPLEIAGRIAERRKAGKPIPPCRSETTIVTYVGAVVGAFEWLAVDREFDSPFTGMTVTPPAHAPKAVTREPFSVEALNTWFARATKEVRPDDYWLPLLGTLTGARIGELAYLQGGDIQEVRPGLWVANLMRYLTINGKAEIRQIKNDGSRRLFALHQELVEVGFVAYAKARRDSEWVFPHLHRDIADPADTASKRQGARLRAYGLHTRLATVFHSSRHSAKDLLRIAKVDPRTSSMQTGHAFKTVEESYGSKTLRADEVEVLAAMPLPEGLDLSPYRTTRGPARQLRRKKVRAASTAAGE
ncbi:hypothetical protein Sa4125_15440 [Aureimonas sp. SA4125]|uniref:hypothetical protein n=1 Tax=Aureimonas sp. SA4125 TaxID=2826993 RepID=UPI001CC82785|nr:hypothetical protein [Aureimonas sp. SA4125]BDA84002.1 hypothetical protein Sa4125_15440 [Aureimonas sp. SA4125]